MNTTMADPFAGSSGIAIVNNIASPPGQPLRDGLVKGPYEGFYIITLVSVETNIFSKGIYFILIFKFT